MSTVTNRKGRGEYWQQQVNAWKASGQSQRAFCDANGLSYANFGYWSRKLRGVGAKRQQASGSGFVSVTLQPSSGASRLRLTLPNGIEIQGIEQAELALVGRLVALLS